MKKYIIMKAPYTEDFSQAEKMMNEMAEKGWDVVSTTLNGTVILITFSRDE